MDAERLKFIASIKDAAIDSCKGTKLFPSLMIAQACLESNDGKSGLSVDCNNFFGIKLRSSDPLSEGHEYDTKEYINGQPKVIKAYFRKFETIEDCFKYRNAMLERVPAYSHAGVFTATSPEGQANALRKAGYATDPAYPQKLIKIITDYNLKKYDVQEGV